MANLFVFGLGQECEDKKGRKLSPYFGLLLMVLLTLWKNELFARIGRRYLCTENELFSLSITMFS